MKQTVAVAITFAMLLGAACAGDKQNHFDKGIADELTSREASRSWIDHEAIDHSTQSADDFYQFVNGGWLQDREIPDNLPWISPYAENYFEVQHRLETIIHELTSKDYGNESDEQRASDLYRSYLNVERIERLGLEPLRAVLSAIDDVSSRRELTSLFAKFNRHHYRHTNNGSGYSVPLMITARPDDHDPSQMIAVIWPAGLGMSSANSYISDGAGQLATRSEYKDGGV